jgi:hypothetical protein
MILVTMLDRDIPLLIIIDMVDMVSVVMGVWRKDTKA